MELPYSYLTYRGTIRVHTDVQRKTTTVMERREQTVSLRSSMFSVGHWCLIHNHAYIFACFFFTSLKRIFLVIFRFIWVYQSGLCSSIITQETLKCHWCMINHMFCLVSRNNNIVVHIHIHLNDWLMDIIIAN